jgi:DNA-binding NarL/FixJ family response regulator
VIQDKVQYRRKKILELRGAGLSNVAISDELGYCLSTVEKDIQKIRLGVGN